MKIAITLFIVLTISWAGLSGETRMLLISLGVVSRAFVTLIVSRMNYHDGDWHPLDINWRHQLETSTGNVARITGLANASVHKIYHPDGRAENACEFSAINHHPGRRLRYVRDNRGSSGSQVHVRVSGRTH